MAYKDKERRNQYSKEWQRANRERINGQRRKWRKEHPEESKRRSKKYNQTHRNNIQKWFDEHKEEKKEYDRIYHAKRSKHIKSYNLSKRYGISIERYIELFNQQGGKCAICCKPQTEFNKAFAVDHNHITGAIRGLLCMNCNLMISRSNESSSRLAEGIIYLKRFEEESKDE